jgi:DNA-binding MarR family transcriptional regulator
MAQSRVDLADYKARGFECFAGNARMAARSASKLYDDWLRPSGMRASQLAVLWAVLALEPVTARRIAAAIVSDETTLSRSLKVLAADGLIELEPGEDRRSRIVTLTRAGRRALERALPLWDRAQEDVRSRLGAQNADTLARGLLKLSALGR